MKNSKYRRITITLTPEQLDMLNDILVTNNYESMSRTIRVLVNKYGKKEIKENN